MSDQFDQRLEDELRAGFERLNAQARPEAALYRVPKRPLRAGRILSLISVPAVPAFLAGKAAAAASIAIASAAAVGGTVAVVQHQSHASPVVTPRTAPLSFGNAGATPSVGAVGHSAGTVLDRSRPTPTAPPCGNGATPSRCTAAGSGGGEKSGEHGGPRSSGTPAPPATNEDHHDATPTPQPAGGDDHGGDGHGGPQPPGSPTPAPEGDGRHGGR